MSHNDREVYLHLVWATKCRQPTLPERLERAVYRVFHSEAAKLGCRIVAADGTQDHIHLLIQMGPQVSLSRIINQLKGVSSFFINENRMSETEPLFRWQDGYGAFSVGMNQTARVATYTARQKERHAKERGLWKSWEPTELSQSN